MNEIRASALAIYAEEEQGNPLLVARDEYGVLRPVTRVVRVKAEFVSGNRFTMRSGRGNWRGNERLQELRPY